MNASELFIKALENEGVEYIFGVPGEENLDFLEAMKGSKIKLVLTRHEQGAAFIASTFGRLTVKAGVCLATLEPGATNFVTGAAYSQLGAMPMMMISGQKPIKKSKQGRFQILDIVEMMKPLTKFTKQVVNGNTIPALVREAFRLAEEERPGAVHLELPEDIAREASDAEIFEVLKNRRPSPDPKAIQQACEMIQSAQRPLLLLGGAANRNRTSSALLAMVDKFGIPFCNTQMGKGVLDERHQLFLGTAALSDNDYLHCALERCDLIINVGHDVIEKPPFFMEHGGKKVIHVNHYTAQVDDVYFPQLNVIGDITSSIDAITAQMKNSPNWDFSYHERVKKEIEVHIQDHSGNERFPSIPQRIVADVRKAMPEDGMICLDNGIYKIWFARNYKAYQPNTVLLDNALATMGAGLPSAIGAKMVYPNRKVMAICGDGGFMMNSQEMETVVRMGLDLVVLILRDNAYGMIKWKQAGMGFDHFGLDYGNPDFVKYAESYGANGIRVESTKHLSEALDKALNTKGAWIVECPVDYSENERVLIEELQKKTCIL